MMKKTCAVYLSYTFFIRMKAIPKGGIHCMEIRPSSMFPRKKICLGMKVLSELNYNIENKIKTKYNINKGGSKDE